MWTEILDAGKYTCSIIMIFSEAEITCLKKKHTDDKNYHNRIETTTSIVLTMVLRQDTVFNSRRSLMIPKFETIGDNRLSQCKQQQQQNDERPCLCDGGSL